MPKTAIASTLPMAQKAKKMARECRKRLRRIQIGDATGVIRALHIIGKSLLAATPKRRQDTYARHIIESFTREWEALGGFPICPTTAKYARQFAAAFDRLMLEKALEARLGWTQIRRLSSPALSPIARRKAVEAECRSQARLPSR